MSIDDKHPSIRGRVKDIVLGKPKSLEDKSLFHKLSLIPILAWIGLGSDGLSSSSYGPEEAFRALNGHTYLAVVLALATAFTVWIISAAYSHIIETFPHGGGGYVVASKLLGHRAGVLSGCALVVDYVLTITTSIAASGDAIFSFLPPEWVSYKMTVEVFFIIGLVILNIRGLKESVLFLAPIFIVFVITHLILIFVGIFGQVSELPHTINQIQTGFSGGMGTLGILGMTLLFAHSYSLGGGAYTGIEAVSNGLPIMREPKVYTAKKTMVYMAVSLAFTAAGLLVCYLLWNVAPVEGKTLNAVLVEKIAGTFPTFIQNPFIILTLFSEGLLLVVAAQAGFIDGPRVLANMAVDSWMPRRFAALSDRLTTGNGIGLMGGASLLALFYAHGSVSSLVVMYSINVFMTFSLSIFGMLKLYLSKESKNAPHRFSRIALFGLGFSLCATILVVTTIEKFTEGGWVTLMVTGSLVVACFWVKSHYLVVAKKLRNLSVDFKEMMTNIHPDEIKDIIDPEKRTAVILVGGYGGLGAYTIKSIFDTFPDIYKQLIFVSVGVIDSGGFKGEGAVEDLRHATEGMLKKYVDLSHKLGIPASYRFSIGTEVVAEGLGICEKIGEELPKATFFTSKVIFEEEQWYQRLLHNETAISLQKHLQFIGLTMVILPAKL